MLISCLYDFQPLNTLSSQLWVSRHFVRSTFCCWTTRRQPYVTITLHSVSTGSQQLGGTYGQQPYYTTRGRRPYYAGQRPLTYGGQSQPTYGGQSQPVYGGGSVQQPFYSYGYNQAGFDTSGYDSVSTQSGPTRQDKSVELAILSNMGQFSIARSDDGCDWLNVG